MRKCTFVPLGTLGKNRSQGLKQSLLRPYSSRNKHSNNGTPSVRKEENVSYAVGEKGTPSVNLQNDSDFNAGVNEEDHLTPLETQGSADKSVCTPSLDEEGREQIDGSKSMDNKKKRRNFKPHGPNKCKKLANLKNGEKLELTFIMVQLDKFKGKDFELDREATLRHMKRLWHYWRGNLEEILRTSKDNPHFSAFELVEECFRPQDRDHVACLGYGMKPKDVRGPLISRAALQAMLQEKEKENIALHKCMDDMENANKNDMDKLEDQLRMLANLVMANRQTSGANTSSNQDDTTLHPDHLEPWIEEEYNQPSQRPYRKGTQP
ncbi:hypothetical protein Cgig2_021264 [Carnegiea gigantea]|uniref:Uncharacterized protein n=1 Tax=Carnegiea gigantea TaxID=171969 RepID=A0A9Q1JZT4_9CARY|nr:hypothetical protein Cgig2_021264 [Carnegiea gigantea]